VASDTESKVHFIRPELRARGGLFIGEIKGPITMSQLPIGRVHSQGGKLDYYFTQLPSERTNELSPRVAAFLASLRIDTLAPLGLCLLHPASAAASG
jgi:hypothetical protein